ncbi:unnamed protein product, partial [Didymodactylos carnosus]
HRAWQIGDGKLIPWKDLIQQAPTISLIDCVKGPTCIQWSHTTRTTTHPKSDKSTEQTDEDTVKDADDPHMALYDCIEEGCVQKFLKYGNFVRHLLVEKHHRVIEKYSLADTAMKTYQSKLEKVDDRQMVCFHSFGTVYIRQKSISTYT